MAEPTKFIYANNAFTAVTPWEALLVFQRMGMPDLIPSTAQQPGQAMAGVVADRVDVAMNHAHAKLFAVLFLRSVIEHERANGKSDLPATERQNYADALSAVEAGIGVLK